MAQARKEAEGQMGIVKLGGWWVLWGCTQPDRIQREGGEVSWQERQGTSCMPLFPPPSVPEAELGWWIWDEGLFFFPTVPLNLQDLSSPARD